MRLKKIDIERIAVSLDTEGTIGIEHRYRIYKGKKASYIRPYITCVNKNRKFLLGLKEMIGAGNVCKSGSAHRFFCKNRDVLEALIPLIKPRLVIKRPQAELLIEWFKTIPKHSITSEVHYKFYLKMRELNKGKEPIRPFLPPQLAPHLFSRAQLETLYVREKMSIAGIARKLDCSPSVVQYKLEKFKIPRRTRLEGIHLYHHPT